MLLIRAKMLISKEISKTLASKGIWSLAAWRMETLLAREASFGHYFRSSGLF